MNLTDEKVVTILADAVVMDAIAQGETIDVNTALREATAYLMRRDGAAILGLGKRWYEVATDFAVRGEVDTARIIRAVGAQIAANAATFVNGPPAELEANGD